jgi:hypothetical protein
MGLSAAELGELALFVARFAGPTAALGTIFIPFNRSLRQEDTVSGWPPLHFLWHSDEHEITFSYLRPDLQQVTKTAQLGQDGLFRNVDGKVIGRALPDGGVVIDRLAILPKESRGENEPSFCPKPTKDKDHGNLNGLAYEDYMKSLVNPGNPTPSKFGIEMRNPNTGDQVTFDDCQRRSGILFQYKGPTYSTLLSTGLVKQVRKKLINQAMRQTAASEGRHIVWIFEEHDAEKFVESVFNKISELKGKIQFD